MDYKRSWTTIFPGYQSFDYLGEVEPQLLIYILIFFNISEKPSKDFDNLFDNEPAQAYRKRDDEGPIRDFML